MRNSSPPLQTCAYPFSVYTTDTEETRWPSTQARIFTRSSQNKRRSRTRTSSRRSRTAFWLSTVPSSLVRGSACCSKVSVGHVLTGCLRRPQIRGRSVWMHSVCGNHHKGQDLRRKYTRQREMRAKWIETKYSRATPVIHDQSSASRAAPSPSPSTTSPRTRARRLASAPPVASSTLAELTATLPLAELSATLSSRRAQTSHLSNRSSLLSPT